MILQMLIQNSNGALGCVYMIVIENKIILKPEMYYRRGIRALSK